ncbi:MAG TPA: ATP-binding protein [Candidatus Limnocylindrales bacterium]
MSFSPRPTADGPVARSTHEAPFVGRDAQLGVLLGTLDDSLAAGRPHHVLVEGAAGIGKSRLVREFLGVARDRASAVAVLQARCLATSRGSSHWPSARCSDGPAGSASDVASARNVFGELGRAKLQRPKSPLQALPEASLRLVGATVERGESERRESFALGALMATEKNVTWGRSLSKPLGIVLIAIGGSLSVAALMLPSAVG